MQQQYNWGGLKAHVVGHPEARPRKVTVLLHGFGAPGTDLVPVAGALDLPPECLFVFPEAPLALPPEHGGGRAWWLFDFAAMDQALREGRVAELGAFEPPGLAEARQSLEVMLGALQRDLDVSWEQLVIGGFSQGSILACDTTLRRPTSPAGLLLFSSMLICGPTWAQLASRHRGLQVFQSHGAADSVLPLAVAEPLHRLLEGGGLKVQWHRFEGGHGIAPSVLSAARGFLVGVHSPASAESERLQGG